MIRDVITTTPIARVEKNSRRAMLPLAMLALGALIVLAVAPFFGTTPISPGSVWGSNADAMHQRIFWEARLPRVLFGFLAGAALALAGAAYQAVLRNDLAEPFTLGVAGAAAVGSVAAAAFLPMALAGIFVPLFAFVFAMGAVMVIFLLARASGSRPSPATVLLAGVSLNFLFAASILLIQYLSDPYQTLNLIRWLMGGLDGATRGIVLGGGVLLVLGGAVLLLLAKPLNLLSVGDTAAFHLGVSVARVRWIALIAASLLAAGVVSFAGPIGFVGLIVPHAVRRILGGDNRLVMPGSLLLGGSFLVACDALARVVLRPAELPVGILTAFLGAPFFLFLLLRRR